MGNMSNIVSNCTTESSLFTERSNASSPFLFKNSSPISPMRLSQFRSTLQKPQCFYALNTLIQQYYSLYRHYGKAVVSDQLCYVTKFGQIKVDFLIDGPQTPLNLYNQVAHSLVTIVAEILQTVSGLALQKSWLETKECAYFQQKITQIIYKFHSTEDRMYQEILQEINQFMEHSRIKCNLIGAVIRHQEKKHLQEKQSVMNESSFYGQTPYLAFSRSKSQSQLLSQVDNHGLSQFSLADQEQPSTAFKIKDTSTKVDSYVDHNALSGLRKQKSSVYRHKMVRTEGEAFFNSMHSQQNFMKNHETYLSEVPPTERPVSKEESHSNINSNHISAQYSIHILNAFTKDKKSSYCQKVKFKGTGEKSSSYKQNESDQFDRRKKTSLQEMGKFKAKTEQFSKIYTKSVLNDLARSVEVQEEPSSRSYIF